MLRRWLEEKEDKPAVAGKQTTIKVWRGVEIIARELVMETLGEAVERGKLEMMARETVRILVEQAMERDDTEKESLKEIVEETDAQRTNRRVTEGENTKRRRTLETGDDKGLIGDGRKEDPKKRSVSVSNPAGKPNRGDKRFKKAQ